MADSWAAKCFGRVGLENMYLLINGIWRCECGVEDYLVIIEACLESASKKS